MYLYILLLRKFQDNGAFSICQKLKDFDNFVLFQK